MVSGFRWVALVFSVPLVPFASLCATTIQTEQAELLASDGEHHDRFGHAVSISGNTAIIGAPWYNHSGDDSGSAYVFRRSRGVWEQQDKLQADAGTAGDEFGYNVSSDGNTAVIGAPLAEDNGRDSGAAYIFVRINGLWTQQAKLLPSDGAAGDHFGNDVSVHGDIAIIGALRDGDGSEEGIGSAYIFERIGTAWLQQAKLLASDGAAGDSFGSDVSLSDNTAIVGAPWRIRNETYSGAAYIFVRVENVWVQQAMLLTSDGKVGNGFGCDVAVHGDTAIIGAYRDDDNGAYSGAAYVFVRGGSVFGDIWRAQAKLLASDGEESDFFGAAVSLYGDTAVIGASFDDDNGGFSGAAYVFERRGREWTEHAKLLASNGAINDNLGFAVSAGIHTAIVGAPRVDDNGEDSGAAYVFSLPMVFLDGFESGDVLSWSEWVPHCSGNSDCGEDEFCKKNGCDDLIGFCKLTTGFFCIDVWDPVCGCDGVTYSNACYADEAGVNIASIGECPP